MAKKSRKERKDKNKSSQNSSDTLKSSEILRLFKSNWNDGKWEQALVFYRTWCNKSKTERNPKIESELLFRAASSCFSKKQFKKASELTGKAEEIYSYSEICRFACKGITLARLGQLEESKDIFIGLNDSYHEEIITFLLSRDNTFPDNLQLEPTFQHDMILKFWLNLKNDETAESSSSVLNLLKTSYTLFSSGLDPASKLKLLESKTGFYNMAVYLRLLAAIDQGSSLKVRNILKKNGEVFLDGTGNSLLNIHLKSLLKKKDHKEILVLNKILKDVKTAPPSMEAAHDIALFNIGLEEIRQGHLEKALNYYSAINSKSPAVLHNKALILQKLERYNEANECWTVLCRENKKPKRSDPENLRISYGIMLKYVAENYRQAKLTDKAQTFYKEALSLNKLDIESLEALYEINSDNDKLQSAFGYAKQLYKIDRNNDEYISNYTLELARKHELKEIKTIYKEAYERDPKNSFYRDGILFALIKDAMDLRNGNIEELKKIVEQIKIINDPLLSPFIYLEGFILHREGQPRKAMKKINQAISMTTDHIEDFNIACTLYEDGFIKQAMEVYHNIADCGCAQSEMIIPGVVNFLSDQNDMKNTVAYCNICAKLKGWDDYFIAGLLLDLKRPIWAERFSERLIDQNSVDEDDSYLHLLILNDIGNKKNTLEYALNLHAKAKKSNDEDTAYAYKCIIKEIKTRGKFKTRDE